MFKYLIGFLGYLVLQGLVILFFYGASKNERLQDPSDKE